MTNGVRQWVHGGTADGGYRQKIKQKFNQEYSPEPRDIYFTVPNLISVLRIASIPFIAWAGSPITGWCPH